MTVSHCLLQSGGGPHKGSVGTRTVTPEARPPPPPRSTLQGASHPCRKEKSHEKTLDHRNVNP